MGFSATIVSREPIMPDKKLPAVPETILKRRKRQQESRAVRAAQLVKDRVAKRKKRVDIFKRAEKYVKEYRDRERDELRLTREAKKSGNFYVPSEPKLAFVMRINTHDKCQLRLRRHVKVSALLGFASKSQFISFTVTIFFHILLSTLEDVYTLLPLGNTVFDQLSSSAH